MYVDTDKMPNNSKHRLQRQNMVLHLTFKAYVGLCLLSSTVLILLAVSFTRPNEDDLYRSTADGRLSSSARGHRGNTGEDNSSDGKVVDDPDAEGGSRAFVVNTPGCTIPNIDPFDATIRHLVAADNLTVHCNATPPMTFTDGYYLRINRTALRLFYDDELDYCEYQTIYRPVDEPPSDNRFGYRRSVQFTEDVDLHQSATEFLRVACFGRHRGMMLYTNFHAVVLRKQEVEQRCQQKLKKYVQHTHPKEMFNFLLLGVDSVSRLNFVRHMPRTRRFLLEQLNAFELLGYNKVADNTYVNLVPMFAGRYVEELPWDEQLSDVPFDNYTFIWNEFSARGYRTLYAEDAPSIAIFNYNKAGFHHPPADYYLRPFSLALEDHGAVWNAEHDCVGARLETDVVLDWIVDFEREFRHEPHLSFAFLTRLTHEDVRKTAAADQPYEQFFRKLRDEQLLEKTVIIFYSDHGIRFGELRQTYIGKMEERLPFFYVILPPKFAERYPDLTRSLGVNKHRLTTPFDVYETLMDLMDFEGHVRRRNKVGRRGCTLLDDVPTERTCASATVLPHWCTCHHMQKLDNEDPAVQVAARAVVDYINAVVGVHGDRCATLQLDEVLDARRILPIDDVMRFRNSRRDVIGRTVEFDAKPTEPRFAEYQLTLETFPGGAVFEATVRSSHGDGREAKDSVPVPDRVDVAEVSRINAYGDQSSCIDYHTHKKFCYCVV